MNLEHLLSEKISASLTSLFSLDVKAESIGFQRTNPDFEGDITLVVFPYVKASKKSPEETARLLGDFLKTEVAEVDDYNVVKGFLNLVISASTWLDLFETMSEHPQFGIRETGSSGRSVMVEFSSPNTNKPLHLGHIRNILLGYSVSKILEANGDRVIKTNLINDRGVHICKSMLAWKRFGNAETPESSGMKGDHLSHEFISINHCTFPRFHFSIGQIYHAITQVITVLCLLIAQLLKDQEQYLKVVILLVSNGINKSVQFGEFTKTFSRRTHILGHIYRSAVGP